MFSTCPSCSCSTIIILMFFLHHEPMKVSVNCHDKLLVVFPAATEGPLIRSRNGTRTFQVLVIFQFFLPPSPLAASQGSSFFLLFLWREQRRRKPSLVCTGGETLRQDRAGSPKRCAIKEEVAPLWFRTQRNCPYFRIACCFKQQKVWLLLQTSHSFLSNCPNVEPGGSESACLFRRSAATTSTWIQ